LRVINPEDNISRHNVTSPGSKRLIENYERKLNKYEEDFKCVVNENCELKIKLEQLSQMN